MAVDTQKFLALPPAKKGGSLISIKTKIVKASDILKGTLAAEKKQVNDKKKIEEQKKRKGKEEDLETPENKETKDSKKLGIKLPKMSWMDSVKNYIFTILFGWVAVRLLDFLPTLVKIVKPLASIADFILKVGGVIFNALVTFVDIGYKAYDWTRGAVKKIGGENAAKGFDSLMGHLNKVMNLVIALGLAASAMAGKKKPKGPKGPKGKQPKWQKRLQQKWKKSRLGRRVRNLKAVKTKLTRRVSQAVKPQNIAKNLRNSQFGKNVTNIAQRVDPRKWKMPQLKTPGWMKTAGTAIKNRTLGAVDWVQSIPAKTRQLWDDVAKRMGPYIDEMGEGIGKIGKNIGAQYTNLTEKMKPQKIIDDLMAKVRPAIDDVLKKNPIIGKLLNNLKPKNAKGSIRGLLTKAAKNPALKKVIATLKANKGASKGLGPVDKIITALTALADYTIFKESPINAILKGLGGLLGYGVGFSAATAVPVLGQSGVFNFAGGMAGGIAGEWLAMKMAKFLAGTELGNIDDPIMGPKDVEAGLPARKLVRDPDGLMDHMIKGVGGEDKKDTVKVEDKTKKSPKKIDKTFKSRRSGAEYDLSKTMGGLSRKEWDALDTIERKRILQRQTIWQGQNKKEWAANIKNSASLPSGSGTTPINVSSVQKNNNATINGVSKKASYENGASAESLLDGEGGNTGETASETKGDELVTSSSDGSGSISESAALQYKKAG